MLPTRALLDVILLEASRLLSYNTCLFHVLQSQRTRHLGEPGTCLQMQNHLLLCISQQSLQGLEQPISLYSLNFNGSGLSIFYLTEKLASRNTYNWFSKCIVIWNLEEGVGHWWQPSMKTTYEQSAAWATNGQAKFPQQREILVVR